jgi:hypothetical protein
MQARIKKLISITYLHNHFDLERRLGVPSDHVIVDREDWEEIVEFFTKHPEHMMELTKPKIKNITTPYEKNNT